MLPLREVGVLGIAYADTENRTVERNYWKPKSPNNVYVVTDDFEALLAVGDDAFHDQLTDWVASSDQRLPAWLRQRRQRPRRMKTHGSFL